MKTKSRIFLTGFAFMLLASCRTVHFDKTAETGPEKKDDVQADEPQKLPVEEEIRKVETIVYVDRPVYSPLQPEKPPVIPGDAVAQSFSDALQVPMKFVNGVMYYPWDETFVYEIHTQPYRTTDIMLEPGEEVLEMPFLSEEQVWEIGAGVSRKNGQDVQHFFVKPSRINLTTSMIIITDRRVYHLILKSFSNRFMVMVRWNYPPSMPFTLKTGNAQGQGRSGDVERDITLVDPAFLSFDYRMTYRALKKPAWIPKRIYDDGRKTYIELSEQMLAMESPVLFNKRNERINYRVHKNLMVIDELIEKVTLKRGKEKITIVKKKYKKTKQKKQKEDAE
jgi:type IV secretion system protein VirB9